MPFLNAWARIRGYAEFCRRQAENIRSLRAECFYLLVGATAVGTGLGAAPGYQEAFYKHLSVQLGEDVKSTADLLTVCKTMTSA